MKRSIAPFAAAMLLAACASSGEQAPAGPAPLDPVGTYDFSTSVEGTPMSGVITITRSGTGYGGSITTDLTDPMGITAVTVEGQKMMVSANTPDGPVTMAITMNGMDLTGSWTYGPMAGTLSGKKRS